MNFVSILLAALLQGYPDHTGVVNDFANVIDADSKGKIESTIHGLKQKADIRLVVVTVASLQGESIEGYSAGLTAKWGIGQRGKNNGVLLIYAPNEHKVRIENGYGVESRLTDIESKTILHEKVAPLTKAGQIGKGLLAGVQAISDLMSQPGKEPEPIAAAPAPSSDPGAGTIFLVVFILGGIIVLIYFLMTRKKEAIKPYSPPEPEPMPWLTDPPRTTETPSVIPPLIAGAALGSMYSRPRPTYVPPPPPPPAQEEDDDDDKDTGSSSGFGGSTEKDDDFSSGSSSSSDDDSFAGGGSGGGGATEDA